MVGDHNTLYGSNSKLTGNYCNTFGSQNIIDGCNGSSKQVSRRKELSKAVISWILGAKEKTE